MLHRRWFTVGMLALAACGGGGDATGRVVVALVTSDSRAEYVLPPGTSLVVSSGSYQDSFSLDGFDTTFDVDLPPGPYALSLRNGGYDTIWPIQRLFFDESSDVVDAKLVTPLPAQITVPSGGSVPFVLRFEIGDQLIAFDAGSLDVSLSVAEVNATSFELESLTSLVANKPATVYPAAPPAIVAALPPLGTANMLLEIDGSEIGPWALQTSTRACARASVRVKASPPVLQDLVQESQGLVELCVVGGARDGAAVPDQLVLHFLRFAEPFTATFAPAAGQLLTFETTIVALPRLPRPIYDGVQLDLSQLNEPQSLTAFVQTTVGSFMPAEPWFAAQYDGVLALHFVSTR